MALTSAELYDPGFVVATHADGRGTVDDQGNEVEIGRAHGAKRVPRTAGRLFECVGRRVKPYDKARQRRQIEKPGEIVALAPHEPGDQLAFALVALGQ